MADKKDADVAKTAAKNEAAKAKDSGSLSGAEAVADAVKRVADAAVEAVQKSSSELLDTDFRVSGTPGGSFEIVSHGKNFGASGTVTLNGQQVKTTEWSTTRIFGSLPAEAKDGEVVVHVDDKTSYSAHFKA